MSIISEILKDSDYKLDLFSPTSIQNLEKQITQKPNKNASEGGFTYYTKCLIRDKEVKLTPEEIVRQLYLDKLIGEYGYAKTRIQLEYPVHFGREVKRADIVIFDDIQITAPYIIVELKKPKAKDGKEQLKSYCNSTGATIAVWSNGEVISYYHRKDPNYFEPIPNIPQSGKSLKDVLNKTLHLMI